MFSKSVANKMGGLKVTGFDKDSDDQLSTSKRFFAGDSIDKRREQEVGQTGKKTKRNLSYDKPWRQTEPYKPYQKENKTLKRYLRRYNNVDENVLAVRGQENYYQLVHAVVDKKDYSLHKYADKVELEKALTEKKLNRYQDQQFFKNVRI